MRSNFSMFFNIEAEKTKLYEIQVNKASKFMIVHEMGRKNSTVIMRSMEKHIF